MEDGLFALHEEPHLPEVGHVVLAAGGGAGIADKFHGDAREHESLGHRPDHLRVAVPDPAALRQHGPERRADHALDMVAVIFTGDDMGQLPVQEAGVFAQHVAEARRDHLHGRLCQDLRVPDDRGRGLGVIGDLDVVDDQSRSRGHKAVHGRRGRQDDRLSLSQKADILAQVIDGSGADSQDQVGVLRQVQEKSPDRPLIRHQIRIRQDKGLKGKAGIGQPVRSGPAGRLPGVDVGNQEGLVKVQIPQSFRQPVQGAAAYIDGSQVCFVRAAAAAAHLFSKQGVEVHDQATPF